MADTKETEQPDTTEDAPPDTPPPGPDNEPLGEGGKRALQAERELRKAAEETAKTAQAEAERALKNGATEIEKAKAEARAEARAEVLAEANQRLLKAEVKAAAAGKLRRPEYATSLLDLSQFAVSDDGMVDAKAIESAIDKLVEDDPDLAATPRPGPLPGGGARPTTGTSVDDAIRRSTGRH